MLSVMGWLLVLGLSGCEVRRPPRAARLARPTISLLEAVRQNNLPEMILNRAVGADLNQRDGDQATPLHWAAQLGHEAAADLLIMWGADINATDARGQTPMHRAAAQGQTGIERLLIAANANINLTDRDNQTPALLAHRAGHMNVFDLLISAGAEFDFTPEVEEWVPAPAPVETARPTEAVPARIEGAFTNWTSISSAQLEAEFVDIVMDRVILRTPQNEIFRIPIHLLRREDQIRARELAGAAQPRLVRRAPPVSEKAPGSPAASLGPRIGTQGGWTLLEGCRWKSDSSNDGDSFHVLHEGKEYIFRLYYVDAPEKSLEFPQRVEDQARYFGLTPHETLEVGHEAARFTEKQLAGRNITVATRWENARGQSHLPRRFAFVTTEAGDLDELLVAHGLACIYGMPIDDMLGNQKRQNLKRLEAKARQANLGGWAKHGKSTDVATKP